MKIKWVFAVVGLTVMMSACGNSESPVTSEGSIPSSGGKEFTSCANPDECAVLSDIIRAANKGIYCDTLVNESHLSQSEDSFKETLAPLALDDSLVTSFYKSNIADEVVTLSSELLQVKDLPDVQFVPLSGTESCTYFSRVGLDISKTEALLFSYFMCREKDCGDPASYLAFFERFKKENGHWVLQKNS